MIKKGLYKSKTSDDMVKVLGHGNKFVVYTNIIDDTEVGEKTERVDKFLERFERYNKKEVFMYLFLYSSQRYNADMPFMSFNGTEEQFEQAYGRQNLNIYIKKSLGYVSIDD